MQFYTTSMEYFVFQVPEVAVYSMLVRYRHWTLKIFQENGAGSKDKDKVKRPKGETKGTRDRLKSWG